MDLNTLDMVPRDEEVIKKLFEQKKRDRFQEYANALDAGLITPDQYREFMKQFNPWFLELKK